VNGRAVAAPVRLTSGDVLELARVRLIYVDEDQPASAPAPGSDETTPLSSGDTRRWWPF
jgi:hypothetical protein